MDRQEIFDKIKEALQERGTDTSVLSMESSFNEDLGLDSLDQTELLMEVEDFVGKEIPDEEAQELTTVGKLVEYIEKVTGVSCGEP